MALALQGGIKMLFFKNLDTLYVEYLVRKSKKLIKFRFLYINYNNLIKKNPLKLDHKLLNLAEKIRLANRFRSTQALQNACSFLISSNLLFSKYNTYNQADPFKLPGAVLSSFTCELFIKYWMLKDKHKKIIPFQLHTDDHTIKFITLNWAFYTGASSRDYLKDKKFNGTDAHLLSKLLNTLPDNLIEFHEVLFKKYYSQDADLKHSLEKIAKYFIDGRYSHENVELEFDIYLSNSLANFFFDSINFIINSNPKSVIHSKIDKQL